MKKKPAGLDAAVRAMQLYCGSVDFAAGRQQQRFYDKAMKASDRIATALGISRASAFDQILTEAQRRGCIRPIPGQHI